MQPARPAPADSVAAIDAVMAKQDTGGAGDFSGLASDRFDRETSSPVEGISGEALFMPMTAGGEARTSDHLDGASDSASAFASDIELWLVELKAAV